MFCFRVRKRLIPYSDGSLGRRAEEAVARHLARCPKCAQELALIEEACDAFRSAKTPAQEPAADLWGRIEREIAVPAPVARGWHFNGLQLAGAGAAAAVLLFAALSLNRSGAPVRVVPENRVERRAVVAKSPPRSPLAVRKTNSPGRETLAGGRTTAAERHPRPKPAYYKPMVVAMNPSDLPGIAGDSSHPSVAGHDGVVSPPNRASGSGGNYAHYNGAGSTAPGPTGPAEEAAVAGGNFFKPDEEKPGVSWEDSISMRAVADRDPFGAKADRLHVLTPSLTASSRPATAAGMSASAVASREAMSVPIDALSGAGGNVDVVSNTGVDLLNDADTTTRVVALFSYP